MGKMKAALSQISLSVQCVGLLSYFAVPEHNASSKKQEIRLHFEWILWYVLVSLLEPERDRSVLFNDSHLLRLYSIGSRWMTIKYEELVEGQWRGKLKYSEANLSECHSCQTYVPHRLACDQTWQYDASSFGNIWNIFWRLSIISVLNGIRNCPRISKWTKLTPPVYSLLLLSTECVLIKVRGRAVKHN
jgi:hypothetical protein